MFAKAGKRIVRHGTQEFTADGSFVVPATVTEISVVIAGAGGGYGLLDNSNGNPINWSDGGAPGGGETVIGTVTVVPGETITVTVGRTLGLTSDGEDSSIAGSFGTIAAAGGRAGANGTDPVGGNGGDGGGANGGAGGAGSSTTGAAGSNGTSSVVGSLTRHGGGGGGGGGSWTGNWGAGGNGFTVADGDGGAGYDNNVGEGNSDGKVIITW